MTSFEPETPRALSFAEAWEAEAEPDDSSEVAPSIVGSGVPAVVAVVVCRNPGPWFDLTIESLANQEYANLATLVVDVGSVVDPADRVADRLPGAFVKRVPDAGFAAAVNAAAESVEGAAFLLILHDDVALASGAVQAMVEEAFRSNAGIVGPKLVDWDHPDRLRSVGAAIDKFGFGWPVAEPGELDQAQHDAVRDVFVLSTAALLIRTDLFADLGGFPTDIDGSGEELDLCWRARVAGARTVITTAAVVRHRERSELGDPTAAKSQLALRHQIRSVLANYSWAHLARVIPQALVLSTLEVLWSLARGRVRQASRTVGAVMWNLGHVPTTLKVRREVSRLRRVKDSEIRALQIRGSARVSGFLRGRGGSGAATLQAAFTSARTRTLSTQEDGLWNVAAVMLLAAVVLVGSRGLIAGSVPALREFTALGRPDELLREWWSGWRAGGLGGAEQAPTLLGVVGAVEWLAWIGRGTVRTVLFMSPVAVGGWAVWRGLRGTCSPAARGAAMVAYLANPMLHNAIAEGRWQALVVTAVIPMVVVRIARAGAWAPLVSEIGHGSLQRQAVGLGLVMAGGALVAPLAVPISVGVAVAVVLTMAPGAGGRLRDAVIVVGGALGFATLLHLPFALTTLGSSDRWARLVGRDASAPDWPSLSRLVRFDTGPHGGVLSIGLLVAAMAGLVVAQRDRWRVVLLGSVLIVGSWAAVVLAGGELGRHALPAPELLAAPVGAGLAFGIAFGVDALRDDVAGRAFGLRQVLTAVATLASVVALLPFLATVLDGGRWGLPTTSLSSATNALREDSGGSRTLWLGVPDALPSAGRTVLPGLGYSLTGGTGRTDGGAASARAETTISASYPVAGGPGEAALRNALRRARDGTTARLGSELGRFAVRYVVVVERAVPPPFPAARWPIDRPMDDALSRQLDLLRIDVVPGLVVYENLAARPLIGALPKTQLDVAGADPRRTIDADTMVQLRSALTERRPPTVASGTVDAGESVIVSANRDDRWSLSVGGETVAPREFASWASSFVVSDSGTGTLRFATAPGTVLMHLIQLMAVLTIPWFRRRRVSELRARFTRTTDRADQSELSDQSGQSVREEIT